MTQSGTPDEGDLIEGHDHTDQTPYENVDLKNHKTHQNTTVWEADEKGLMHGVTRQVTIDGRAHEGEQTVTRALQSRHLQMIAIGGTIGTGLFVGSGGALATAGPVGTLLGYVIVGAMVYAVMISLGEMTTLYPVSGSFTHYATRFVDPALGFALGYNYWYSFAVILPNEITAAAIVIGYWNQTINTAAWVSIFLVAIIAINFVGVAAYSEAEFWMSFIKVITIVGLIIIGIVLDLGGGPNHDRIGFRYWKNPGPFNQFNGIPGATRRFLAFWSSFVQAAFSYQGTEIVAVTAGEAQNPTKTIPKAIRRVFYRILLFYVGGIAVIGLLVPYTNDQLLNNTGTAAASPFVIAIETAGITALPSIINAVILFAAFSAGNSDLYTSSRTLYALALDGKTPAFLRRCTRQGLPIWCVAITSLFGFLAYLNAGAASAGTVFEWFVNISTVSGLFAWATICFSYTCFFNAARIQGLDRNTLPYKTPFQPYAACFGCILALLIILFNGWSVFLAGNWSTATFIADYIGVPIFVGFYLFWKIYQRSKLVRLEEIDLLRGGEGWTRRRKKNGFR
ncbi:amino acid transporter [Dacryopinax primogenitus]|uniref:Amino acid transporter n=1 Tax=Dacryopinax primogenitus (strain DJM 731) TaxID=1858805 RepID=M5FS72_DACPD|nr:amino acid transporter [Dacryopinax primogenitus]EJT98004.1 amino acid transporter [Dacryopinax primogenitus]